MRDVRRPEARAADWRFLLPEFASGSVLCVGPVSPTIRVALPETTHYADAPPDTEERFDVVAVLSPAPARWLSRDGLAQLVERVSRPGTLYLEIDRHPRRSPSAMVRTLGMLGVDVSACYWPHPDFRHAERWLPLGAPAVSRYYLDNDFSVHSAPRRLARSVLRTTARRGVFDQVVPRYAIVAARSWSSDAAVLEKWLRACWPAFGLRQLPVGTPLHLALLAGGGGIGWRRIALVWRDADPDPCLVVKFPRDVADNSRAAVEPAALGYLETVPLPCRSWVPRPLGNGTVLGRSVSAETALPGRPLLTYLREATPAPAACVTRLHAVPEWLVSLDRWSARPLASAEADAWIDAPLQRPLPALDLQPAEERGLAWLAHRARGLDRAGLRAVFGHNDAGPPNVLVDRDGGPTGLVDWESGGWGLPLRDLLYFLARLGEELGQHDLTAAILETPPGTADRRWALAARPVVQEACRACHVDPAWLPVLAALTWLHHAGNEVAGGSTADREGSSRRRLRHYLMAVAHAEAWR